MIQDPRMILQSATLIEEDGKIYREYIHRMEIDVDALKADREKRVKEANLAVELMDEIEEKTPIKINNKPKKINK